MWKLKSEFLVTENMWEPFKMFELYYQININNTKNKYRCLTANLGLPIIERWEIWNFTIINVLNLKSQVS